MTDSFHVRECQSALAANGRYRTFKLPVERYAVPLCVIVDAVPQVDSATGLIDEKDPEGTHTYPGELMTRTHLPPEPLSV
jgi:hypothetical protein